MANDHHRLHEGGWQADRSPDGSVEFTLVNGRILPATPVSPQGRPDDALADPETATLQSTSFSP